MKYHHHHQNCCVFVNDDDVGLAAVVAVVGSLTRSDDCRKDFETHQMSVQLDMNVGVDDVAVVVAVVTVVVDAVNDGWVVEQFLELPLLLMLAIAGSWKEREKEKGVAKRFTSSISIVLEGSLLRTSDDGVCEWL
eukprot:scaffold1143_cov96-Cylindrotheca_fusiformis.AAC.8